MMRLCIITFCIGALSVVSAQAAAVAASTFDSDLDGWTPAPPGLPVPILPEVIWDSPGGNDGGYARFDDRTNADTYIEAPAEYLGDWSSYDGVGTIYYDHLIADVGGNTRNVGFEFKHWLMISGPGGSAGWQVLLFEPLPTGWVTNAAPLDQGQWTLAGGTWAGLLADVQVFRVGIEATNNGGQPSGEVTGIDNILIDVTDDGPGDDPPPLIDDDPSFLPKVPEPVTVLALLAAGGGLGSYVRKRRRRIDAASIRHRRLYPRRRDDS